MNRNIRFHQKPQSLRKISLLSLRNALKQIAARHNLKIKSLEYVFLTDEELLKMNQDYLQHNTYTDIITFDLSDNTHQLEGEIYISWERVKDNAKKYNTTETQEMLRVLFHGLLHLCGLKDKSKTDAHKMRLAEEECIALYHQITTTP
ncbi:MAG: rRNA maturation RNase YbeY [Bacteroidetes bacterium]|nr:rRNA maturation RNase YbeY [Bacteroidota bacterium]